MKCNILYLWAILSVWSAVVSLLDAVTVLNEAGCSNIDGSDGKDACEVDGTEITFCTGLFSPNILYEKIFKYIYKNTEVQ